MPKKTMGQDDTPAICSVVLQLTTVNTCMRDAVCFNPVTMEASALITFHEHHNSMYTLPSYFSVPMFQGLSAAMEVTVVTFNTRTETFMSRIFSFYEYALLCAV
jgi:hypothetical protein